MAVLDSSMSRKPLPLLLAVTLLNSLLTANWCRAETAFQEQATDGPLAEELGIFFNRFRDAIRNVDEDGFLECFDFVGMLGQYIPKGTEETDKEKNKRIEVGVRRSMINVLPMMRMSMLWKTNRLVHLESNNDATKAIVITRDRDDDNIETKTRWWLTKQESGWRVTDFEDIAMGMRLTSIAILAAQADGDEPWVATMPTFMQLAMAMAQEDIDAMRESLATLQKVAYPKPLRAVLIVSQIVVLLDEGETEQALKAVQEGCKLDAKAPMWSYLESLVHLDSEDGAKAQKAILRYVIMLGHDADTYGILAESHRLLGDMKLAQATYEKLLAYNANVLEGLTGYWDILPKAERVETLRPFLVMANNPIETLTAIADYAFYLDDLPLIDLCTEVMTQRKLPAGILTEAGELRKMIIESLKEENSAN